METGPAWAVERHHNFLLNHLGKDRYLLPDSYITYLLECATSVYVSEKIYETVHAMPMLPVDTVVRSHMPPLSIWCDIQRTYRKTVKERDDNRAIFGIGYLVYSVDHGDDGEYLEIVIVAEGWSTEHNTWSRSPVAGIRWANGSTILNFSTWIDPEMFGVLPSGSDATASGAWPLVSTAICFVFSLISFMSQRLIVAETSTIERHARKRLAQRGIPDPQLKVVILREQIREGVNRTSLAGVEWQHHWLVKGHWRKLTTKELPTWVRAHFRGPDDKPFLPPKQTIFSVTR